MNTEQIRNTAIERHDIDADHFQSVYSGEANIANYKVFMYGRNMIIQELEKILNSLPKGSKILDVGCGTAHLAKWMKDKEFDVCGIEPSEKMYAHAVQNFPDIEIKKAVSSTIPYPDNYFDMIVSIEVLRYLDHAENIATYKEFKRILKSNGKFFITQTNLFCTDFYFFFHHIKNVWRKIKRQPHPFCNFTTYSRQNKIVEEIGFTNITTIGRMAGSIRIFYKFGDTTGDIYRKIIEKISKQRHTRSAQKLFSGHLIVIGEKR